MLRPGLGRATAFALIGFLVASLIVIALRAIQGLDPLYDPSVGIVLGGFAAAVGFVGGMGAFNPLLSAHGPSEAEAHRELEARAKQPRHILTSTIWSLVGWLLLILVLVIVFATLPFGFALRITADPLASTSSVGQFEVTLGNTTMMVSQLTVLLLFIGVIFVSLAAAAWVIQKAVVGLNNGVVATAQEAGLKLAPSPALEALPSGQPLKAPPDREPRPWVSTVKRAAIFVIVFAVLYLVFYYVAIGLIFPAQPWLTILSLVNAVIFTVLLVRPASLLHFIGWFAGQLARFVRWLPKILFQRG